MITAFILIPLFLCWGSFLNVVAYRLIAQESLFDRSRCIACAHSIAWYDLIPFISFIILSGKCRTCHQPISFLYPFIELFTTCSLMFLYYYVEHEYFFTYFLLFSALIITIRTDLETMLISRWVTVALIPLGIFASFTDTIAIEPLSSITGMAFGYILLWFIGIIFYALTKKTGIGEGDFELLAMIGSFTGIIGVWITLLIGSALGSIIGIFYLYRQGTLARHAKLAFGPFLASGAIIYIIFQEYITFMFLGITL